MPRSSRIDGSSWISWLPSAATSSSGSSLGGSSITARSVPTHHATMGRCRAMRSATGWRTRCARASSAPAVPSAPPSCSMRLASGGSCRALPFAGSTPTRRCSSEGCGRCCCSRCTRWRWRASPSTATTATTRGVDCSAPPTSSPRPRSVRPPRPSARSGSSAASMSTSTVSRPTGGSTRRSIRISCVGCTSPRSTASSPPTRTTAIIRSRVRTATSTWPRRRSSPASSASRLRPSRNARCATNSVPTGRSCGGRARPARWRSTCSCSHRCRSPRGPAYLMLGAAAVALLPRWARAPLRLPYMPIAERVALRPAGEAVTRTLRWALARRPTAAEPD